MEAIRELFSQLHPISNEDWNTIKDYFVKETFRKGHILLEEGAVENYLYYIETGIIRAYTCRNEQEITFEFSFANTLYSAYVSFLTRSPSEHSVQAITPISLWKISYDQLQQIYRNSEVAQTLGRLAAENLFIEKSKREVALLKQSPTEMYHNLFTEQPLLLKYIPLKYIASYIGVTPQALSRIRKRIT